MHSCFDYIDYFGPEAFVYKKNVIKIESNQFFFHNFVLFLEGIKITIMTFQNAIIVCFQTESQ
jgi:hypothetical protein